MIWLYRNLTTPLIDGCRKSVILTRSYSTRGSVGKRQNKASYNHFCLSILLPLYVIWICFPCWVPGVDIMRSSIHKFMSVPNLTFKISIFFFTNFYYNSYSNKLINTFYFFSLPQIIISVINKWCIYFSMDFEEIGINRDF